MVVKMVMVVVQEKEKGREFRCHLDSEKWGMISGHHGACGAGLLDGRRDEYMEKGLTLFRRWCERLPAMARVTERPWLPVRTGTTMSTNVSYVGACLGCCHVGNGIVCSFRGVEWPNV
jgi:hypothetical protein